MTPDEIRLALKAAQDGSKATFQPLTQQGREALSALHCTCESALVVNPTCPLHQETPRG